MFKEKLKQLRIKRGLTQSDVANAIGVSPATIGNYEQGSREPKNNEMWKKLADYFEVTVDELMDKNCTKTKKIISIVKSEEDEYFDSLWNFRKDCPIIYNGVDITALVHAENGKTISITPEQRRAKIEFSSRSGHVLYARRRLLEIIFDIKKSSKQEIINSLLDLQHEIETDVAYWYKRCWCNIDDVFPQVIDTSSLYDLINICLILDDAAIQEFYLVNIPENFDWLRDKLR